MFKSNHIDFYTLHHMKAKIDHFLFASTNLKSSSKRNYRYKLMQFAEFLNFKDDFNEDDVLTYLNSQEFQKLKISTQNLSKNVLRRFMKFYGLNHKLIKTIRVDPEIIRKEDLLSKKEINAILKNMVRSIDKCIFMIGIETGPRASELRNIKLKDIIDKGTHIVIYITKSKSLRRPIYLIQSVPFLIEWLNQHPDRDNPEQYLFCHKLNGILQPYSVRGIELILERNNPTKKRIFPHLLRHTSASSDYNRLSEKEMMKKFGWKTRAMIDRYAHMVDADLESKILELHGIIPKQEKEDTIHIVENRTCPNCNFMNPGTNKFCSQCGRALDIKFITEIEADVKEVSEFPDKLKERILKEVIEWYKQEKKEKD